MSSVLFWYGLTSILAQPLLSPEDWQELNTQAQLAAAGSLRDQTFTYTFNADGLLQESPSPADSTSPYWWLDSGGKLEIKDGIGHTVAGALPWGDKWRSRYLQTSSLDTDQGQYPQNLFRLVTRQNWRDLEQSVRVRIDQINTTPTPNRGEWSGVFLMGRYVDKDTLYYAGVRMDGAAVIKKKYHGVYYTLAYKKIFKPAETYDYHRHPNLLPVGQWLGLQSAIKDEPGGSVRITLSLDQGDGLKTVLDFTDVKAGGVPPIAETGRVGIRTDFLDASFDDYRARSL